VAAALEAGTFLVRVHDPERGGASLDQLKEDCKDAWRDKLFESGCTPIAWMRFADYQVVSLKQIVAQLLHASPSYHSASHPPRLYLPGEISRMSIQLHKHVVLAVSPFNPGAADLANELTAFLKISGDGSNMLSLRQTKAEAREREDNLELLEDHSESESIQLPRRMLPVKVLQRRNRGSQRAIPVLKIGLAREQFATTITPRFCKGGTAADATHLLLYLSKTTFVGRLGAVLAEEVREARSCGVKVVLAHETDRERDSVEFATFFRTTPSDLIADQLFGPIAVPLAVGEHRSVSYTYLLKDLGASVSRRQMLAVPLRDMKKRASSMCSLREPSPNQRSPTDEDVPTILVSGGQQSADL
jgi:hypothetical protein